MMTKTTNNDEKTEVAISDDEVSIRGVGNIRVDDFGGANCIPLV